MAILQSQRRPAVIIRNYRVVFCETCSCSVPVTVIHPAFIIILRVLNDGKHNLFFIGKAGRLPRFGPRLRKDRKQNRRQNRDNCNYDKQLNQGKTSPFHFQSLSSRKSLPGTFTAQKLFSFCSLQRHLTKRPVLVDVRVYDSTLYYNRRWLRGINDAPPFTLSELRNSVPGAENSLAAPSWYAQS